LPNRSIFEQTKEEEEEEKKLCCHQSMSNCWPIWIY